MSTLIGIDVGGTNLRLGVVEYDASNPNNQPKLIDEIRFSADFSNLCKSHQHTPEQAGSKILATTSSAIEAVRTQYPKVSVVG